MNLNETYERLKRPSIYYNSAGLKQVFFRMLIEIIDTDPVLFEQVVKYSKPGHTGNFALTAIVDEERDKLTVIENILTNLKSQNLLWENHFLVNRNIEAEFITKNPSINSIGTDAEKEDDKNKFMSFSSSALITRESAKQKLNNGAAH
jgi:hypothetical protein